MNFNCSSKYVLNNKLKFIYLFILNIYSEPFLSTQCLLTFAPELIFNAHSCRKEFFSSYRIYVYIVGGLFAQRLFSVCDPVVTHSVLIPLKTFRMWLERKKLKGHFSVLKYLHFFKKPNIAILFVIFHL